MAELEKGLRRVNITVSNPVPALLAIVFGILVILLPDLLEWLVGLYFIIQGVLLFSEYMELRRR